MTKYFDLLRAHQQNKAHNATDDSIEVYKSSEPLVQHNPYTQQQDEQHIVIGSDVAADLVDEEILHDEETVSANQPEISVDALPNEEGAEEHAETTEEHTPQAPLQHKHTEESPATNTGGFSVASWLQNISQTLQGVFQAAEQQKSTDLNVLEAPLHKLMEQFENNSKVLDALELEISRNIKHLCHADCSVKDLVEKSIMMMLYTIKISLHLKLQHHAIVEHAMAAMLHHIGMAMVPSEVRHKVGKLSKDELALIHQARENAVTYLQSCHVHHESILLAAEQAAERYDGSGPLGLSEHDIAWIARLVGLLSMFVAMIHASPYHQRLLPRDAIRELVKHHKTEFDPVLLKALIEAVSLYPIGIFVQLNTGEIGQVIRVHSKFPLRPVVYVNMDKQGNPIATREIDLQSQPNLMIQKSMYEDALGNDDD